MLRHLAQHVGEHLVDVELAGDLAVVEGDAGAGQAVEVLAVEAVLEDRLPLRQRHAPLPAPGEHAVRVAGQPAALEPGVHGLREHAEVVLHGGVVGVVVGEPVVLVRGERELRARRAAEGEPGVRDRRLAETVDGELEEPRRQRVVKHGEDARHRRRVDVRRHEVDEELGDVGRSRDDLVLAARRHDLATQGERAARLERHQAARGEDADHLALAVQHGHVVHAGGHHRDAGLGGEDLGADGVHRRRHDLGDRGVPRDAAHDHLVAQVDVGDDAGDAAAAGAAHQDRRALLGDHDLRGLLRASSPGRRRAACCA